MEDSETGTMDGVEEWPQGRASALVVAGVLSGISAVLTATYCLTRGNEFGISLKPLYAWEIILFTLAISAMVAFSCLRKNNMYVVNNVKSFSDAYMDSTFDSKIEYLQNEDKTKGPFWTRIPYRIIAISICGIGSMLCPIVEACRSIENMVICYDKSLQEFRVLKTGNGICCAIFCICQLVFLLLFKTKSANNMILRLLISTIMAANFTLFVNVVLSSILASDTVDIQTNNNGPFNLTSIDLQKTTIYIKCSNATFGHIDYVSEWFHKYCYQLPFEFAVLSLCYLGPVWNVFRRARPEAQWIQKLERQRNIPMPIIERDGNVDGRIDASDSTSQNSLIVKAKHKYRFLVLGAKSIVLFTSTWAFPLAILFFLGIFGYHLYTQITYIDSLDKSDILVYNRTSNTTDMHTGFAIVQTVYIYIICIIAPVGFMVARKENISNKLLNQSDILLLVATTGHLIYITFETVDFTEVIVNRKANTSDSMYVHVDAIDVFFYIKLLLKYLGVFAECMIVLISSKMEVRKDSITKGRQLFIKGTVTFLGVFNLERSYADNFLSPNVLRYVEHIDYHELYGRKVWWLLVELLYPFVMTFRMTMAIMCFEICVRLKCETLKETRS